MKPFASSELFRQLPSVDELLRNDFIAPIVLHDGRIAVTEAARSVLDRMRDEISSGKLDARGLQLAIRGIAGAIEQELQDTHAPSLQRVINATGVILHTNLGRAPLATEAFEHARAIATSYSNLEFDLETGERGKRDSHTNRLFARLFTDVERELATIVVNNNAAAVLLALNALAEGGEVIVSRGELVEIGGSFRIPDVMAKSGAVLREVGTTNRTRIADYEQAINERTKLLLRVHRSNFEIVGFTEQPSLEELVTLARRHKIPVMEDLGSGALINLRSVGIANEPDVFASLRAGVDVVTYSGDKLLGGPQAGLLTGSPALIAAIRANPLFRAVRVDKMFYAALEATLLLYLRGQYDAIPALRMMRATPLEIAERAEALANRLRDLCPSAEFALRESQSVVGGGAAPAATLPTTVLAIRATNASPDELARRLRSHRPAIVARVEDDAVILDLRTVAQQDEQELADGVLQALQPTR